MTIERPTFSDSWHRLADLTPRLREATRVVRQCYRGRPWYVVEERHSNQFVRLSEPAWRFVGLLDGKRTVDEAWQVVLDQLGDEAPTQPEVTQVLSQLYSTNLVHLDATSDVESLLRRRRQRIRREVRGYLGNLLFIRFPLFDPDRLLDRLLPLTGWLVSPLGLVLWLALLTLAAARLAGRGHELASGVSGILATDNLPLLYLTFAVVKLVHELAHGIFCKKYGRPHRGGEVHAIGIMLLLFMPIPYVDASSAWAFRSRTQRVLVAAAGMMAEVAIAALAILVWTSTAAGTPLNAIAFNVIFVAGVSTILFNGNPLLRYDGYYMLSDLTGTPNLAQRSNQFIYYLVKRYLWRVRHPRSTAYSRSEGLWLTLYALSSGIYRLFIYTGIIIFIANQQFLIGMLLVVAAAVGFVVIPLGTYINYLATSVELHRVRGRAALTSVLALLLIAVPSGAIPLPDHHRAEGVLRGRQHAVIAAEVGGVITDILADGTAVRTGAEVISRTDVTPWQIRARVVDAELRGAELARRAAVREEPVRVRQYQEQIETIREHAQWVATQVEAAAVTSPVDGIWICPDAPRIPGTYVARGETLGLVTSPDDLVIRVVLPQRLAALVIREASDLAEVRIDGVPFPTFDARIVEVRPAGTDDLPGPALGIFAGGSVITDPRDASGAQAMEQFFEARLELSGDTRILRPGQRMIVRFRLQDRPLLMQGARWARQVFQERFRL
ncbi:MAG: hypothetical protein KDA21_05635 [Phycisphaerales bacterium]|nr:hypothetical protein [Phycisphaerales bacterium]